MELVAQVSRRTVQPRDMAGEVVSEIPGVRVQDQQVLLEVQAQANPQAAAAVRVGLAVTRTARHLGVMAAQGWSAIFQVRFCPTAAAGAAADIVIAVYLLRCNLGTAAA